jgi:glutamyl-tRNA synthetase
MGGFDRQINTGSGYRGRWAPSPTGHIHLGNARTALLAWLSARKHGGTFIWRSEDLDRDRVQAGLSDVAMDDLRWLGLDWDEGPDVGGNRGPYAQSLRIGTYAEHLHRLAEAGLLYPCRVSRSEVAEIASAAAYEGPIFPRSLRPADVPEDWWERFHSGAGGDAIRFRVDDRFVTFDDAVLGPIEEDVGITTGDFILQRRDGIYSYQFTVVVDDVLMGITEVVRGDDIASSTGRQLLLYDAMDSRPPLFAHVPLILGPDGTKLSKRHDALRIYSLRQNGLDPHAVIGYLAYSCGFIDAPVSLPARDLVEGFSWSRLRRAPWSIPDGDGEFLRDIRL